jgi:hypothetical protein
MDIRTTQALVNAQVEVNRAVHAMNMLCDPGFRDQYAEGDVQRHTASALEHLQDALIAMAGRKDLLLVRALLPASRAFVVRKWERQVNTKWQK